MHWKNVEGSEDHRHLEDWVGKAGRNENAGRRAKTSAA